MCHPGWARARIAAQRLSGFARLRRVRDRIDREYARPLDVEALARAARMPAGQLSREFRLAYGASPYGYLTARRVERAVALLLGGGDPAGVWSAVGCATPGVLRDRFTGLVGAAPAEFAAGCARAGARVGVGVGATAPG
ncbi:helix-turn-helix domain-containing protein [Kitasatospora sp. NPDC057936]|uniref:helix-turn-helix domain-containing protein n=1 Tax=Kitasatospora sp. NPDC057936 TaxID=3346283 RepID=UPI0036DA4A18